jgi:thiol-disulfide isomerase/thioredoxin
MLNYKDLKHIEVKDFFNQKEKEYYVYLYFTYCPHCNAIREYVLGFAKNNPDLHINFICMDGEKDADLFADTEMLPNESREKFISRYVKESIGKDKIDEVNYYFVPSLYKIKDGKVVEIKVAEDEIMDYLQDL